MNLLGRVVLTKDELFDIKKSEREEAWKAAREYWEEEHKERIEGLEKKNKRLNKEVKSLGEDIDELNEDHNRDLRKLQEKIAVLEDDRDEAREVVKREMELDDLNAVLDQKKETLDEREARLRDRESKIDSHEEKNYKQGYADGASDMMRKSDERTDKDRDNMAKVAMVAAASHTQPEVMKEMNSAYQITAGTSDKKA